MNRILVPVLVVGAILLLILSSMLFVVRERDHAMLFALGEVKEVISEPGLYFKLPPPFQHVVYLDKRLLTIDTSDAERIQTSEMKNLLIYSIVTRRVAVTRQYYGHSSVDK